MQTSATYELAFDTLNFQQNYVQHNSQVGRSRIAVIYTGGTIGMIASDNGLVPGDNMSERLMQALQNLPTERLQALPDADLLTLPRLIDSSNATSEDWLYLHQLIACYREQYQGFVILHGTDTLAYTASALSFLLPADQPVVITGSQHPLEAENSDACANVEGALRVTQHLIDHPEHLQHQSACALVFFGQQLLQGNRTTKFSTWSAQGFTSINQPPLGRYDNEGITLATDITLPVPVAPSPVFVPDNREAQVVILKLWPGIQASQITSLLAEPVQGVILESYGSGNAPDLNQHLLAAFKAASERGVVIVNRSQCPQGAVNMNYAAGSALAHAGVISAFDMTCEAAFSKLTLLLMSGASVQTVREQFQQNMRAEFSA